MFDRPGQSLLKNWNWKRPNRGPFGGLNSLIRWGIHSLSLSGLKKIGIILTGTLWFAACQTLPRWESRNPWSLFPTDASFYLSLFVPEHRTLLDTLLSHEADRSRGRREVPRGISYFLDHTVETYLAVLGNDRWIVVGVGEYSSFLLRLSLTPEEGWEKRKLQENGYSLSYFQHQGSTLQVALPDPHLLIVSDGAIEFPLRRFVGSSTALGSTEPPGNPTTNLGNPTKEPYGAPGSSGDYKNSRPINLYIPKSSKSLLTRLLEPLGLQSNIEQPEQEFALEAIRMYLYQKDPGYYTAEGSILFQKEEQARSISVLVRLALAGWFLQQESKGIPNSIQIRVQGKAIEFAGIPLSVPTIAQFIHSMVDTIPGISP